MTARDPAPPAGRAVTLATLRQGCVYRAPSGRLCTLLPVPARGPGSGGTWFAFAYLDSTWVPPLHRLVLQPDAFRLSAQNVPLLREVRA